MKKTIEELEQTLEQVKKDLEELKSKKQTEEWKPEVNQWYWWVDLDLMEIKSRQWENDYYDSTRLNHKVVFRTEKEAEEWLDYLIAKENAMNEFCQEDWENSDIRKYYICCYYDEKDLTSDYYWSVRNFNAPYFHSKKEAQAFIDKYEKQIKRDMGMCN